MLAAARRRAARTVTSQPVGHRGLHWDAPLLHADGVAPDPRRSAEALVPGVAAAGVFGIQDPGLAGALVGASRVAGPPLATPVLLAVSGAAIHVLDWDHATGSAQELARFDRPTTWASVEDRGSARRLTLRASSGYVLPLTCTVSRAHPYGAGARAVLATLAPGRPGIPSAASALK